LTEQCEFTIQVDVYGIEAHTNLIPMIENMGYKIWLDEQQMKEAWEILFSVDANPEAVAEICHVLLVAGYYFITIRGKLPQD
jgi:hypothetical protein